MRVIPQSFEPIVHTKDHVANIGSAARICYKSEKRALKNERSFVNGLLKGNHNSTLEFSVVHLEIQCNNEYEVRKLLKSNYIITDEITDGIGSGNKKLFCTGSIRSWREFVKLYERTRMSLIQSIFAWMYHHTDGTFSEDLISGVQFHEIREFDPTNLPPHIAKRHIHQAIKIITNRVVTHEVVRHRPVSYLQESQRYCRYDKDQFGNEVTFIDPRGAFPFYRDEEQYALWEYDMKKAEITYIKALDDGATPEEARLKLPNSCKTEIIVFCNLVEWEHILKMRYSSKADKSMQEIMGPIFEWFVHSYPAYFDTQENLKRSIG